MTDTRLRVRWRICLVLAALTLSPDAQAQVSGKVRQIGVVWNVVPMMAFSGPVPADAHAKAYFDGLRELGWIDGKNIRIHWRSAEGRFDRIPAILEELVRIPVDVLVVSGPSMALEAMKKTQAIPIVLNTTGAAVGTGLAPSLGRPGGNLTGFSFDAPEELNGKRLALLKQAAPHISRVAFLSQFADESSPKTQLAARDLGLSVFPVRYRAPDQIERAFGDAVRQGADAVVVVHGSHVMLRVNQETIHQLAKRYRLPAMHFLIPGAETGGLMAYGFDVMASYRRIPYFIDRILKGAKPSELPIEQPTKFELVVNLKAAKAIGLKIPPSVLVQADRVIE